MGQSSPTEQPWPETEAERNQWIRERRLIVEPKGPYALSVQVKIPGESERERLIREEILIVVDRADYISSAAEANTLLNVATADRPH